MLLEGRALWEYTALIAATRGCAACRKAMVIR